MKYIIIKKGAKYYVYDTFLGTAISEHKTIEQARAEVFVKKYVNL
jgi:hypothetical protein